MIDVEMAIFLARDTQRTKLARAEHARLVREARAGQRERGGWSLRHVRLADLTCLWLHRALDAARRAPGESRRCGCVASPC